MNRTFLLLLSFAAFLTGKSAIAQDIEAYNCEDCSYDEAKTIATQRAEPTLQCFPSDGQAEITVGNQECYSQSRSYYVYSRSNQQIYAFDLYHTNQGGLPLDLVLNVDDMTPSSDELKAFERALELYEAQLQVLSEISDNLSENFASPEQADSSNSPNAYSAATMSGASVDDCSRSAAYRLLQDWNDLGLKQEIFQRANDYYRTLEGGNHRGFSSVQLSDAQFSLSQLDTGVDFTMTSTNHSNYVLRRYNWVAGVDDPLKFEPSELVFRLTVGNDRVQVEVDNDYTLIDGRSLSMLKHDRAQSQTNPARQVSQCAIEALDHIYTESSTEVITGSGSGGGVGEPGGGVGGGAPGGSPMVGSGEQQLCRKHYYMQGERVLTVLATCPRLL